MTDDQAKTCDADITSMLNSELSRANSHADIESILERVNEHGLKIYQRGTLCNAVNFVCAGEKQVWFDVELRANKTKCRCMEVAELSMVLFIAY